MNLKITHSVIAVQARFESFCLHEIFKDGLHFNTALALSAVHFPQAVFQAECGFAVFGAGAEVAAVGSLIDVSARKSGARHLRS